MPKSFPIIANCNFESRDDEQGKAIYKAWKAAEAGLTDNEALFDALDELDTVLAEHADSDNVLSIEACREAEEAVVKAWTEEIQEEVESARQSRCRD